MASKYLVVYVQWSRILNEIELMKILLDFSKLSNFTNSDDGVRGFKVLFTNELIML